MPEDCAGRAEAHRRQRYGRDAGGTHGNGGLGSEGLQTQEYSRPQREDIAKGEDVLGGFFSYSAQPRYKMGHQIKF